jgi:SAM-dependent methyltransferase
MGSTHDTTRARLNKRTRVRRPAQCSARRSFVSSMPHATIAAAMPEHDPAPRIFSNAYYAGLHAVERSHWYIVGMREAAAALLDAHGFRSGARALDAGCGTGGTVEWMAARFPGSRPVGVDLAAEALRYVQGAAPVVQASVARLPFRSDTFDLVLSFDVLQHLPRAAGDERGALHEAARVLRPGGFLLVRAAAVRWGDPEGSVSDDYHRYRLADLTAEVRAAGLTVVRATPANWLGSLVDDARRLLRRSPPAHGDPGLRIRPTGRGLLGTSQRLAMRAEAFYLRRLGRRLPGGHALLVLATKS